MSTLPLAGFKLLWKTCVYEVELRVPFDPVPPWALLVDQLMHEAGIATPFGPVKLAVSALMLILSALDASSRASVKLIVVGLGKPRVDEPVSKTLYVIEPGTLIFTVSCA